MVDSILKNIKKYIHYLLIYYFLLIFGYTYSETVLASVFFLVSLHSYFLIPQIIQNKNSGKSSYINNIKFLAVLCLYGSFIWFLITLTYKVILYIYYITLIYSYPGESIFTFIFIVFGVTLLGFFIVKSLSSYIRMKYSLIADYLDLDIQNTKFSYRAFYKIFSNKDIFELTLFMVIIGTLVAVSALVCLFLPKVIFHDLYEALFLISSSYIINIYNACYTSNKYSLCRLELNKAINELNNDELSEIEEFKKLNSNNITAKQSLKVNDETDNNYYLKEFIMLFIGLSVWVGPIVYMGRVYFLYYFLILTGLWR